MPESTLVFCALEHHGCIAVRGAQARAFLNAQLSIDLPAQGVPRAPLAAWHTARGRVRSVFRVVPAADGWLLVAPRDALATLIEQLRMFVLRADVALGEEPALAVAALVGAGAALSVAPDLAAAPQAVAERDGALWLRIGPELLWAVAARDALDRIAAARPAAATEVEELAEIRLGLPWVGAALAEHYLPQMLNLDLLGALSFDKGCYPGQEIVARTQHLGSVKRRLMRFGGAGSVVPRPGTAVVDGGGTQVGEIVRAAPVASGFESLAVVRLSALDGALFVAGTELTRLPLPYERATS